MARVLIQFAHPRLEKSKINRRILNFSRFPDEVVFNDLYQLYPDFNVDVEREKALLEKADFIVLHHPMYWYSCPPLLKQWIDMVLELGWAYGPNGNALKGKVLFNSITVGGGEDAYNPLGRNRFTVNQFLAPFDQTAVLCGMKYLPPYAIMGTHRLNDELIEKGVAGYYKLINSISNDTFDIQKALNYKFLNEYTDINE